MFLIREMYKICIIGGTLGSELGNTGLELPKPSETAFIHALQTWRLLKIHSATLCYKMFHFGQMLQQHCSLQRGNCRMHCDKLSKYVIFKQDKCWLQGLSNCVALPVWNTSNQWLKWIYLRCCLCRQQGISLDSGTCWCCIGQLVDTSVSFRNTVLNESLDTNRPVCRKVKAVLSILKL